MANKIDLGTFEFDTSLILAETAELKKRLDDLKKSQDALKKSNDTSSAAYVKNAADLKNLNKEYNTNISQLAKASQATAEQSVRTEALSAALSVEAVTIEEAREQNKALNKLRNTANLTTAEGVKEVEALNKKLDENNAFIKENVDQYTQQKINIGNYSDSIKEAFGELNLLNGGMGGFIARSQEAGGALPLVSNGLKTATTGIAGMTKAALTFIATPLGAVLAAIVAVVGLVRNAMSRSEESTGKLTAVFGKFTGIIKGVLAALEPLGEFLIDYIVAYLELVTLGVEKAMKGIAAALEFLGFEDAAKGLNNFTEEMKAASKAGEDLAKAELELSKAQRQARITQLEYQKEAEKLRQIRDDESKSIEERIKANADLGAILDEQLKAELAIAQQALNVANLRIAQDGRTEASLNAQAEALTEIADIEERITGQRSEQLANLNGLRRDAIALQKEQLTISLDITKKELQIYIQSQGTRKKSLEDELALAEQVSKRKIEIAQKEFAASEKTQADKLQLEISTNEAQIELAQSVTDATISNAERELDIFKESLSEKINANSIFTDEYLNQERATQQAIFDQEQEFAALKLQQGLINQQEYNHAIRSLELEQNARNREVDLQVEQARQADKLQRDVAAFELEQIRLEEEGATAFELEQERLDRFYEVEQQKLNANLAAQQISQETFEAESLLLAKEASRAKTELDKAEQATKLQLANQALGEIAKLLGEETQAGKAAAIAQATINSFQGVTAVLAAPSLIPEPAGSIAKGIAAAGILASGLASVKQIASTKVPKLEQGGIMEIKGKRHSQGGEPIFVGSQYVGEAEANEGIGILNRRAFSSFMNYNNSFANGGVIAPSSLTGIQDEIQSQVNNAQMAEVIGNAVLQGSREGSRQGSMTGSQEGIIGLSENRSVQASSME